MTRQEEIIMAVSGASGMLYAQCLLKTLQARQDIQSHLIISAAAQKIIALELGDTQTELARLAEHVYHEDDLTAPFASGSFRHQGMVICPCSMATLAAVSHGLANNLIHRAADVCLKEKRPLILVTRETPLSQIHLQNMLTASRAGAIILPACPGFYHHPETINDLVLQLTSRILDLLNIQNDLFPRWGTNVYRQTDQS